ncbi:MAG: tetratricopeptide repeat protein [Cyclobacteriaceae bacterium]|nr:tetratricopeptide repeat protein [Cyclobacteriaceae bacterium]
MVRTSLLLALLLQLQVVALSQQVHPLDSLEAATENTNSNSHKVDLLNELSNRYLAYQPQKSKHYAQEALELAQTINYKSGEITALNRLGEYEFRQGNYAKAVEFVTHSLKLAEKSGDHAQVAAAYRVLGNINTFGFKRFDQALQYQQRAYEFYKKLNDKRNIASYCGNITWIYGTTGKNLEEGHKLADLGIHLSDSLGDLQLLSYNFNSKGLLFMKQNRLDSALTYFLNSNQVGQQSNDHAVIAYNKSLIGEIHLQKRAFREAITWFSQALNESKELNLREVLKESYGGLARGYEGLNDYKKAYEYQLLYDDLSSTILNWEITQKTLITELEFAEEKREAKIAELELANARARTEKIIYTILSGVIIASLLIITLLVMKNNRQRTETNRLLQEKNNEIALQNERLTTTNAIKDKLFSIISHDLRTPLASLKGLLGMALRKDISEDEFKDIIPKLNNLVITTNETLENLFQWSQSQMNGWSHQPVKVNVNELADRCVQLFIQSAKTKDITLENKIHALQPVIADENQLELILRNLLNNAIKFTNKGGSIKLEAINKRDTLEIRISDTGIGMPEDQVKTLFNEQEVQTTRGTIGEKGTGLGLKLCKEMVELNGGSIFVESSPGRGTTFTVQFKTNSPG